MRENQTRIIGHLGQSPQQIDGEKKAFIAFNVAVSNDYFDRKKNEWISREPNWIECVAFSSRTIESLIPLKKGSRVQIEGSLSVKKVDIEGKQIPVTRVIASHVEVLSALKVDGQNETETLDAEVPSWDAENA